MASNMASSQQGGLPPLKLSSPSATQLHSQHSQSQLHQQGNAPPAPPQDALPRHVAAPPHHAASSAAAAAVHRASLGGTEAMSRSHSRLPHFETAGGRHREDLPLPPLRDSASGPSFTGRSSVLPISGRGGGVSTGVSASSRRGGSDLGGVSFEQATGRNSEGKLGISGTGSRGTLTRVASSHSLVEDPRITFSEVESLKRQVARLTQLRKDRDVYIQDLLSDAETMQKRHEGELARRSAKNQREVTERLTAQQREHSALLEAHAAAMAQQVLQHELEREDMRRAMRSEYDRELERRLAESASAHHSVLTRLRRGAQLLAEAMADRAAALEAERGGEQQDPFAAKHTESLSVGDDSAKKFANSGGSSYSSEPATQKPRPRPEPPPLKGQQLKTSVSSTSTAEPEPEDDNPEQAPADGPGKAAPRCAQKLDEVIAVVERAVEDARQAFGRLVSAEDLLLGQRIQVYTSMPVDAKQRLTQQKQLEVCRVEAPTDAPSLKTKDNGCIAELRKRLRGRGTAAAAVESAKAKALAWRAWVQVYRASFTAKEHVRQLKASVRSVAESRRKQALLAIRVDSDRWRHSVLLVWQAGTVAARQKAAAQKVLEEAEAAAMAEYESIREDSQNQLTELSRRLRDRGYRAAHAVALRDLAQAMFRWVAAVRERQKESAHRYQLITAAADASAEAYRLRLEARKVATELRRQRRAHGVAAIHASLDRRLQAVVHAWSQVTREAQREVMYQRQLDIAAAESAASCAVLRMEYRRQAAELREQRRSQGLRAIAAGVRHWRHVVLYAWAAAVAETQQEACYMSRLGIATAEVAATRADARLQASEVCKWTRAHASAVAIIQALHWLGATFSAWAGLRETADRVRAHGAYAQKLRKAAVHHAEVLERLKDSVCCASMPLMFILNAWHLVSQGERRIRSAIEREEAAKALAAADAPAAEELLRSELTAAQAQIVGLRDEIRRRHV